MIGVKTYFHTRGRSPPLGDPTVSSLSKQDHEGKRVEVGSTVKTVGSKIGSGTEGNVYQLDTQSSTVVKIFKDNYRNGKEAKIRAMVEPENQPVDHTYRDEGVRSIIWPQEVVEDASTGEFLGYSMSEKDLDGVDNALVYAMSELDYDESSEAERLTVAFNLALMVFSIHKEGHGMGDFNEENIFIDDGYVTLIDCDAFHIDAGPQVYEGDTYLPRYSPPEKRPDSLSGVRKADRFCLGVHIFQCLMEGMHPYLAKGSDAVNGDWADQIENGQFPYRASSADMHPHEGQKEKYDRLPARVTDLFEDCFNTGAKNLGWSRPYASQWVVALGKELGIDPSELPREGEESRSSRTTTGSGDDEDEENGDDEDGDGWMDDNVFDDVDETTGDEDDSDGDSATTTSDGDDWVDDDVFGESSESDDRDGADDGSDDADDDDDDWMDTDPF